MVLFEDYSPTGNPLDVISPRSVSPVGATGDETTMTLTELTRCIRRHKEMLQPDLEQRTDAIFALGRALCAAKLMLVHGQFRDWLKSEFGWRERAAQRYMRVARVLGDKSDIVSCLTFTALIALAAKTTPEPLRKTILTELAHEESITSREVLDRIRTAQGGSETDSRSKNVERAHKAAQLLRENLSSEAWEMLCILVSEVDAKTFVTAIRVW